MRTFLFAHVVQFLFQVTGRKVDPRREVVFRLLRETMFHQRLLSLGEAVLVHFVGLES